MTEPIRVLHVTEAFGGGIYTLLVQLACEQVHAGAEVTIAVMWRRETPPLPQVMAAIDPRVFVLVMPDRTFVLAWLGETFLLTYRGLRGGDFDVVHLHSDYAGFGGRLAKTVSRPGARVLYGPHGFSFLRVNAGLALRILFQLVEALRAQVGGVVLFCDSELETARRRIRPRRSYLLRTGVVVTRLLTPRSTGGTSPPIVTMAGRIAYQKAPWRFAAVARALGDGAQFVWVGDGRTEDHARWLSDAPVEVTGWLDSAGVSEHLVASSVLVFPTWWEGMPMAVMEAQAQGLPAAVSDCVGNRDVVLHGQTGYVTSTDDELIDATRRIVGDPELASRCR